MDETRLRPRRRSSIPGELRGDTSAPALATVKPRGASHLSPLSATPSPTLREHRRSGRFARARRKIRRVIGRWKRLSFRHTWVNPLILVLGFLGWWAFEEFTGRGEVGWARRFVRLSYQIPDERYHLVQGQQGPHYALKPEFERPYGRLPDSGLSFSTAIAPGVFQLHHVQYGKGPRDLLFVAFYTIVLSLLRESIMQLLLRPLAVRYFNIPRSSPKVARFMEQAYTAIYFSVSVPIGLYVMWRSPMWYFQTAPLYEGYPHVTHSAIFKAYYLVQASYWMQQALVLLLQLEKPRKDFWELVAHHLITVGLIASSYRYHFTHMGLAVYIIHDVSDFFLATSKVLNYLEFPFVGPYFFVFAGTWIYFRHYHMLLILYSVLTEFVTIGPFELDAERGMYKYWATQYVTFGLLGSLQAVNLFWLYLILRIAKNYVWMKEDVTDTRSDDEDEDSADERSWGKKRRKAEKGKENVAVGEKVDEGKTEAFPTLEVHDETPRRRSSRQRGKRHQEEAQAA